MACCIPPQPVPCSAPPDVTHLSIKRVDCARTASGSHTAKGRSPGPDCHPGCTPQPRPEPHRSRLLQPRLHSVTAHSMVGSVAMATQRCWSRICAAGGTWEGSGAAAAAWSRKSVFASVPTTPKNVCSDRPFTVDEARLMRQVSPCTTNSIVLTCRTCTQITESETMLHQTNLHKIRATGASANFLVAAESLQIRCDA